MRISGVGSGVGWRVVVAAAAVVGYYRERMEGEEIHSLGVNSMAKVVAMNSIDASENSGISA